MQDGRVNADVTHPLERLWSLALSGDDAAAAALVEPGGTWDDPLFDRATGDDVQATAIPRLGAWLRARAAPGGATVRHLRTTEDAARVVVEQVLTLADGLVWNQAAQRSEKAERFELATAIVGDRAGRSDASCGSIRVYFSTWAAQGGASRMRVGPICPDEREVTRAAMDAMPTVRRYFDLLARGAPEIIDTFEPDGYFREPASNFACGRDQLARHFEHILELGGVGIEFLTATRQGERIGLELQTIVWGTKRMERPQAGFAAYELGPHGLLQAGRVYDSVVPPEIG
ncbi:MAG TPA: hypothetical protein VKB80_33725 [Kofleriaceae bacterium]|nr:hypothetical protein [Kofleriaceae bacterium]